VIAIAAKIKKKVVVLGSATATLTAGHSKTITVSLNAAGKRLLAKHHQLKAKLTLAQSGHSGPVAVKTLTFEAKPKTNKHKQS
jgi:hypothetical protein